jgi:hypothetical protein
VSPPALGNSNGLGRLGDYITDLPYRTLQTRGVAGQTQGPLSYPVALGVGEDSVSAYLRQIRDLLERLPEAFSLEFRTRFIMQPRESISFTAPGGPVTVPAGAAVAVVSEVIDTRFTGFLTHVGVNVVAAGGFPSITWQIRVNGLIHPKFGNRIFAQNCLVPPYPFGFELTQSRTLQLVAINTSAAPIDVAGVLVGWTEFMSAYKPYGSSPATGIA